MTVNDLIRSLELLKATGSGDALVLIDAGFSCYVPWTTIACDDIVTDWEGSHKAAIILTDAKNDIILPE